MRNRDPEKDFEFHRGDIIVKIGEDFTAEVVDTRYGDLECYPNIYHIRYIHGKCSSFVPGMEWFDYSNIAESQYVKVPEDDDEEG